VINERTRPLGRREPTDFEHVDKYPFRLLTAAEAKPTPVVLGINWYTDFDNPRTLGRRQWIGLRPDNLGHIRGGHCVCIVPSGWDDHVEWWEFYDQGVEGSCVGFGSSRAMTLLNRVRYDAHWLYEQAQLIDPWSETPPEEGTDVNSAMKILRAQGHRVYHGTHHHVHEPDVAAGIAAYRWATSADEVLAALQSSVYNRLGAVAILNSWGRSYPHRVYMPCETLDRVIKENGEAAIITDR
jgi:hypothetical protein